MFLHQNILHRNPHICLAYNPTHIELVMMTISRLVIESSSSTRAANITIKATTIHPHNSPSPYSATPNTPTPFTTA